MDNNKVDLLKVQSPAPNETNFPLEKKLKHPLLDSLVSDYNLIQQAMTALSNRAVEIDGNFLLLFFELRTILELPNLVENHLSGERMLTLLVGLISAQEPKDPKKTAE